MKKSKIELLEEYINNNYKKNRNFLYDLVYLTNTKYILYVSSKLFNKFNLNDDCDDNLHEITNCIGFKIQIINNKIIVNDYNYEINFCSDGLKDKEKQQKLWVKTTKLLLKESDKVLKFLKTKRNIF